MPRPFAVLRIERDEMPVGLDVVIVAIERGAWAVVLDERTIQIGRTSAQLVRPAIVIPDISVSRRHCEILPTPSGWALRDLGSCGGLWLNDTTAANSGEPVPLVSGDYFFAGGSTRGRLRYFDETGPAPPWLEVLRVR